MKRLRNNWIIRAMFCGLMVLLWSYPALAQGISFEEAFPDAKVDWKVELPHPKGQVFGCDDGFVFISDDRMHLYRYSTEGKKLWELTDIERLPYGERATMVGGIIGARLSQDGRFVYVSRDAGKATKPWNEYTHEGLLGLSKRYGEYLDAEGNRLWERAEPVMAKISPQGKYLMTERDAMSDRANLVIISGKDGNMLWKKPRGFLAAEFVGDETIALYSNAKFYLFDAGTGNTLQTVDLLPIFESMGLRNIAKAGVTSSRDGSRIVLMLRMLGGKSGIISFDQEGNILWARGDLQWVSLAQVSESGKMLFVDENSSCRLVDNSTGKDIWQKVIRYSPVGEQIVIRDNLIILSRMLLGSYIFLLGIDNGIEGFVHVDDHVLGPPTRRTDDLLNVMLTKSANGTLEVSRVTFRKGGR